jgi:hypothetical protein
MHVRSSAEYLRGTCGHLTGVELQLRRFSSAHVSEELPGSMEGKLSVIGPAIKPFSEIFLSLVRLARLA